MVLGNKHFLGEGVSQNDAEAIKWYLKAAKQGLPEAEFNLGLIYEDDIYISDHFTDAIGYYLKAAAKGHAVALNNLWSLLCEIGRILFQIGMGLLATYYIFTLLCSLKNKFLQSQFLLNLKSRMARVF